MCSQCSKKLMLSFGGPWATTISLIQKHLEVSKACKFSVLTSWWSFSIYLWFNFFDVLKSCPCVGSSCLFYRLVFLGISCFSVSLCSKLCILPLNEINNGKKKP